MSTYTALNSAFYFGLKSGLTKIQLKLLDSMVDLGLKIVNTYTCTSIYEIMSALMFFNLWYFMYVHSMLSFDCRTFVSRWLLSHFQSFPSPWYVYSELFITELFNITCTLLTLVWKYNLHILKLSYRYCGMTLFRNDFRGTFIYYTAYF